jgi:putative ABC transport system substrate-binding protein
MKRRRLALALVLALAGVGVRAQPAVRIQTVGILLHDGAPPGLLEAFVRELAALGYVEGGNLRIETRDSAGRSERLPALADELLRTKVDVILAVNTPAAQAASKATKHIPVVITRVADPVRSGLVSNLARPGGNVTGLSFNNADLGPKRLQLVRDTLPGLSRVAVLSNADNPGHAPQVPEMERAGAQVGVGVVDLRVRRAEDLPRAFSEAARARAQAVFVLDDTMITNQRDRILELAAARSLPVVARYADFAEAGALIAYGPSLPALYRRAAQYVARILGGASPGALPIEEPKQFELVVNLRTARALGLAIPRSVLLSADRTIE